MFKGESFGIRVHHHQAKRMMRPSPALASLVIFLRLTWQWIFPMRIFLLLGAAVVFSNISSASAQAQSTTVLDASEDTINLWPGLTILLSAGHSLTLSDVLTKRNQFRYLAVPYGNLGRRNDAVWLRAEIEVPRSAPTDWWLSIDFVPLDEIDLYVVSRGLIVQRESFNQLSAFNQRSYPLRQPVFRLALQSGEHYELILRIRKYVDSAMIVPASLLRTSALIRTDASTQFWQSLMFGLGACLATFAMVCAVVYRVRLFVWFALFAICNTMSWFAYFGLAAQHLWPYSNALHAGNVARFFILLMPVWGLLFLEDALDLHEESFRISQLLRLISFLLVILSVLFAIGLASTAFIALVANLIGPWPLIVVLPVVVLRFRRTDQSFGWLIAGLIPHAIGLAVGIGLHGGVLPWNTWTDHAAQYGATLDMMAWTMVLCIRVRRIQRTAVMAHIERNQLRIASQTDFLTGLLNRRGLEESLQEHLGALGPNLMLALYLIDLDGFKLVNDMYGHGIGDAALVTVAERLKGTVRSGDLVCRLGGDEFVVVATGLHGESQAKGLGHALLGCCDDPFSLDGVVCELGMTIGYAIAPIDATSVNVLLTLADAVMFEAKREGKRRIRRATNDYL
ncbi:diguanylate cyclase domain-containing protein [Paraburkholderia antibiotica]|uniref:GGDEF domain-containing protein n=1 Tax=Paraburkholderia antibiotica TaxID=2728839 RepID=A0A7X9ZXP5_9BURK|nr:diguanylate cyclase [Paraburkholderia antibiotica]NML32334.1 GGDEF domain-containing protein [Paraburkholderia antibiotica]